MHKSWPWHWQLALPGSSSSASTEYSLRIWPAMKASCNYNGDLEARMNAFIHCKHSPCYGCSITFDASWIEWGQGGEWWCHLGRKWVRISKRSLAVLNSSQHASRMMSATWHSTLNGLLITVFTHFFLKRESFHSFPWPTGLRLNSVT